MNRMHEAEEGALLGKCGELFSRVSSEEVPECLVAVDQLPVKVDDRRRGRTKLKV